MCDIGGGGGRCIHGPSPEEPSAAGIGPRFLRTQMALRMMIVLLISHRNGGHRMRIPSEDNSASTRVTLEVPGESWFQHRLPAAGVHFQSQERAARPQFCVMLLSAEEKLLHQYYRRAEDSVFLSVKRFASISARIDCIGAGCGQAGFLKPRLAKHAVAPELGLVQCRTSAGPPHAPQGNPRLVRDVLQEWGYEGLDFLVAPSRPNLSSTRHSAPEFRSHSPNLIVVVCANSSFKPDVV